MNRVFIRSFYVMYKVSLLIKRQKQFKDIRNSEHKDLRIQEMNLAI